MSVTSWGLLAIEWLLRVELRRELPWGPPVTGQAHELHRMLFVAGDADLREASRRAYDELEAAEASAPAPDSASGLNRDSTHATPSTT